MPASVHAKGARPPWAPLLAVAALMSGVLVAGCGGSSPGRTAATVGGVRTTGSSAAAGDGATSSRSTAPVAGSPGLAFSKCMRSNGVPKFPDPNPGGGLLFQAGAGVNPSSPAFRAARPKCQKLLPGGGPPGPGSTTHPSAQTLAKLLRIARCVREHGVPQFPDPKTVVPSNLSAIKEVTDFDGVILLFPSTINLQAPAYKQALTACGAPPLGLRH
jgi:hypothetical protein